MKERVFYFDTLKFFLIYLVLLGHLLQPNRAISYNSEIYSWIYLFHMPLFIIVSGYFSRKKEDVKAFRYELFCLFETFVVLHFFSIGFKLIVNGHLNLSDLLVPGFASWYLLSLICWRFILQYIPNKWQNNYILLLLSFVVSLFAGFIPIGGVFSIQRTFSMFPFFLLGFFLKQNNGIDKIRMKPFAACFVIVMFTILIWEINGLGELGGGVKTCYTI